ncbi:MAG: pyridoxal phosphate-dependent aminotransferase [Phycisphaerales bacterium]|nr:pyridoxal phosphate-dependent aminotransferase [Phycisphaerales bacterium]
MTTMTLSRRGQEAPASPIRALASLARQAQDSGTTVHYMNIGQPDIETPRGMIEAIQQFDAKVLAYAPSDGFVEYREALASKYYSDVVEDQPPITQDDIVITVGGSEALLFAMAAVTDPGDEIIVCEPYYTNYSGYAHMLGIDIAPVTSRPDDGYRIDPAKIEAGITGKTRALILPNPGNPTGLVLAKEELEALVRICQKHGLFFIADEVYREFVYNAPAGSLAPSLLAIPGAEDLGIVIDSTSKRYSACGARMGWLVTRNREVRRAALHFGQARLSPGTVAQVAGMAALDTPKDYFIKVVEEYKARRDTLVSGLKRIGIDVVVPEGAFYLAVPLPVEDAEDFAQWLVRDFRLDGETLCMAPLAGFYSSPEMGRSEVRLAYVLEQNIIERCINILEAGLKAYHDR